MTKTIIRIHKGTYANKEINDVEATMISAPKSGAKGLFVTVDPSVFGFHDRKSARVLLEDISDMEVISGQMLDVDDLNLSNLVTGESALTKEEIIPARPVETMDEAKERLRKRFATLDTMTHAVANSVVRGLIVSGPPGIGKSFGVEKILDTYEAMHQMTLAASRPDANGKTLNSTEVVKGSVTPIGLYQTLYNMKSKSNIIVFDDCDSILHDDVSLNMLKAALDSGTKRTISWKSESNALKREGIPDSFEFAAGVIFITNLDFDRTTSRKLKPHLDALMSRCHYLDLDMHSMDDCFIRIEQIMEDGLLESYDFSQEGKASVVQFMRDNKDRLQEVSLRMVLKISDLKKMCDSTFASDGDAWEDIASMTCMRKGRSGC